MSDFDDRSGVVKSKTSWGCWWQTIEDVTIEVYLNECRKARDIQCVIQPRRLRVAVAGTVIIEGDMSDIVLADESIWTLEDSKMIRICLTKADRTAAKCWRSLLTDQYEADLIVHDQMQQKLTLQRFQLENPGMDFSGASITGNYQGGGPTLPS